MMTKIDSSDPDFVKIGYRFLKLYLQIYGTNADLLKWADDIITTANTCAVYPQLSFRSPFFDNYS